MTKRKVDSASLSDDSDGSRSSKTVTGASSDIGQNGMKARKLSDTAATMTEHKLTTPTLESIEGDEARQLMDVVDKLRRAGLDSIIQLPQIVTVGDQSSGKSSTLEAITGIAFPRKENLCTRFATQVVLRRAFSDSVAVEIIPDKLRSEEEQKKLRRLRLELQDFSKLGDLIDKATEAMGLTDPDKAELESATQVQTACAFSRDVLSIEVSGPSHPQLTLVDIPGMIHSSTKYQSREDVKLISQLVQEYMEEKRTIILAVVSAKNDYANQVVLSKTSDLKADHRALGIVTKVDALAAGSESENTWIALAQNEDVHLGLGWHMLRNRYEYPSIRLSVS